MNIIAAVAEFERSLISERLKAGIARAKVQGAKNTAATSAGANRRRQGARDARKQECRAVRSAGG
jgi:DNA invertase Pin-like site-specific DNA recombinase